MNRRKREAAEAAAATENIQENAEEMIDENAAEKVAAETVAAEAAEFVEETVPAKDEKDEAIEKLEGEYAELKDQHLRLMAEYDNFRKRTSREKLALGGEIKADCITALLPVIDNIERALASENADAETLRKGVEMVYGQTVSIFERLEVKAYGEPGDNFDPQLHNCVSTVEANDDFAADQITLVMQRGYMLGDKVIRPAMVQVAN